MSRHCCYCLGLGRYLKNLKPCFTTLKRKSCSSLDLCPHTTTTPTTGMTADYALDNFTFPTNNATSCSDSGLQRRRGPSRVLLRSHSTTVAAAGDKSTGLGCSLERRCSCRDLLRKLGCCITLHH